MQNYHKKLYHVIVNILWNLICDTQFIILKKY